MALVIGNGAYRNTLSLPNPKNDANDVATALKSANFETVLGIDLDKAGMDAAAVRFARAARDADVALFYYSGHAMQFAGINYLLPVDAKLTDEADLRLMVRADDIVSDVQLAKNLRIVVLDSCRDNPLAEALRRSIGVTRSAGLQRGLARLENAQGMIVAYATQAGSTADDGTGRNSPYTTAFLRHIQEPDEIGTIFRRVSADVYGTTNRRQLPELSLSVIGDFYLNGRVEGPAVTAADGRQQGTSGLTADELTWSFVKNREDVSDLRRFMSEFPNSPLRAEALKRIKSFARSHLLVQPLETPLTDFAQVSDRVARVSGVVAAMPVVQGEALAASPFNAAGVRVEGVRPTDIGRIPGLSKIVRQGSLADFFNGIVIGRGLADQLAVRANDMLSLMAAVRTAGAEPSPRLKTYKVVAVVETGIREFDNQLVYLPLGEAQSFFGRNNDATGIEVYAADPDDLVRLRSDINAAAQRPIFLIDWRQRLGLTADDK
ncbi:MAG: caspase family protein [Xanthobacteraceae bacterium]